MGKPSQIVRNGFKKFSLIAVAAIALASCGKSTSDMQEDIVRCTGFSGELGHATSRAGNYQELNNKIIHEQIDTSSFVVGGEIYAAKLDPAKALRLREEGYTAADIFIKANDLDGVVVYLKNCAATYKKLGQ